MKRSEINKALKDMHDLIKKFHVSLPPFCEWTPEEWKTKGKEYDEIRDNMLGWDITDFGLGDFEHTGFSLITLRNGNIKTISMINHMQKKLLMLHEGQHAEMHYHAYKMEDIINRGGGKCTNSCIIRRKMEKMADTDVIVHSDGCVYTVKAGTQIRLTPGESITVTRGLYHDFSVEEGKGSVLLGEVSMCNDDNTDNYFYNKK